MEAYSGTYLLVSMSTLYLYPNSEEYTVNQSCVINTTIANLNMDQIVENINVLLNSFGWDNAIVVLLDNVFAT